MNLSSLSRRVLSLFVFTLFLIATVFAQTDVERKTVAVTYPLDETVTVKFRGTTLLPRLKGEAKVRRAGRRGTRVELSIDDLPSLGKLAGRTRRQSRRNQTQRQHVRELEARCDDAVADLCADTHGRAALPDESAEQDGRARKPAAAETKRQHR